MSFLEEILAATPELIAAPLALTPRESARLCKVNHAFLVFACHDAVWTRLLRERTFCIRKLGAPSLSGAALLRLWERLDQLGNLSIEELMHELEARHALDKCHMLPLTVRAAATVVRAATAGEDPLSVSHSEHETVHSALRQPLAPLITDDLPLIDSQHASGKMRRLFLVATYAELEWYELATRCEMPTTPAIFRRVRDFDDMAAPVPGPEVEGFISIRGSKLHLHIDEVCSTT